MVGIEQRPGYLALNCGNRDPRELGDLYRAFAVECLTRQVRRVLLNAVDCRSDGHYALRDALTTMVLAGIPAHFRLAFLVGSAAVREVFAGLQLDLDRLHVHAEIFEQEDRAIAWLRSGSAPPPEPIDCD